jgi:hypothetical protein
MIHNPDENAKGRSYASSRRHADIRPSKTPLNPNMGLTLLALAAPLNTAFGPLSAVHQLQV